MLNSTEHGISTAHKKYVEKYFLFAFKLSDVVFIMLINVVGILTFMSMINFMLS